ncbi:MAG: hypothetical protein R6X02_11125 [Enhygromyxa sp.]
MRRLPVLALALLSCTASGPRSACDERALDHALTRFEADPAGDNAPRELLDAMASACPAFPDTLLRALECGAACAEQPSKPAVRAQVADLVAEGCAGAELSPRCFRRSSCFGL